MKSWKPTASAASIPSTGIATTRLTQYTVMNARFATSPTASVSRVGRATTSTAQAPCRIAATANSAASGETPECSLTAAAWMSAAASESEARTTAHADEITRLSGVRGVG